MKILNIIEKFDSSLGDQTGFEKLLSVFGLTLEDESKLSSVASVFDSAFKNMTKLLNTLKVDERTLQVDTFTDCVHLTRDIIYKLVAHHSSCALRLINNNCHATSLAELKERLIYFNNVNTNEFLTILDELHYDPMQGRSIWLCTSFSNNNVRHYLGACNASPISLKKEGICCIADPVDFEQRMHRKPNHEFFPLILLYEGIYYSDELKDSKELIYEQNNMQFNLPLEVIHTSDLSE